MKTKLHLLAIILLIYFQCQSQATSLDATFGVAGRATCSFGAYGNVLTNMALQSDGKIVACGRHYLNSDDLNSDLALCRFNSDGALDANFGVAGKVALPGGDYVELITTSVKILNDGKILILAYTLYYADPAIDIETVLMRYEPDGTPDAAFGNNGFLFVETGAGSSISNAMAVQPDGKIVIGGSIESGNTYNTAIFRLHPDGSSDNSFGTNGMVNINLGSTNEDAPFSQDEINDIALQSDGKIIVGGSTKKNIMHNHDTKFALLRVNSDGSPDNTFGNGGQVVTNFENFGDDIRKILILPDQKIIATGQNLPNVSVQSKIDVAKYNSDGSLDTTYGNGGKVIFSNNSVSPRFEIFASLIKSDGRLLMAGSGNAVESFSPQKPVLIRLNQDGTPDDTFAQNGVYYDENNGYTASEMLFQPDGKLLVSGTRYGDMNFSEFEILRFDGESLAAANFESTKNPAIYPNPFQSVINVDLEKNHAETVAFSVTDITGKLVLSTQTRRGLAGANKIALDMPANLQSGIYFLQMNCNGLTTVYKIVK